MKKFLIKRLIEGKAIYCMRKGESMEDVLAPFRKACEKVVMVIEL